MLMSEIEIITACGRRRRWSAADKLRIVEETMHDGESISAVAPRNGVAPNLLHRWRKLMLEGGRIAVAADDSVTGNKAVRDMAYDHGTGDPEERAGHITGKKTGLACAVVETGRFAMKTVAHVLEVSRANLNDRFNGRAKPRRGYRKAQDAVVLPHIQALGAKRPTYGDRRITAILNRQLRSEGRAAVNHKQV
jgi:transposase